MMPDWVPAFESYHHSLGAGLKEQLLEISSATLDRFLTPLHVEYKPRRRGTVPGTMLRQEIPIRGGAWQESEPGWLAADTVGLCGGSSFGEVIWMTDTTDICTTWVEQRAMCGRGQHAAILLPPIFFFDFPNFKRSSFWKSPAVYGRGDAQRLCRRDQRIREFTGSRCRTTKGNAFRPLFRFCSHHVRAIDVSEWKLGSLGEIIFD